jgi:hypothetical protein
MTAHWHSLLVNFRAEPEGTGQRTFFILASLSSRGSIRRPAHMEVAPVMSVHLLQFTWELYVGSVCEHAVPHLA